MPGSVSANLRRGRAVSGAQHDGVRAEQDSVLPHQPALRQTAHLPHETRRGRQQHARHHWGRHRTHCQGLVNTHPLLINFFVSF